MQRIVERKPEAVTLLTMQYRMNEKIMQFSSNWFYNGKVVAAPEVKFRGILDLDTPMEWREIKDEELVIRDAGTKFGDQRESQLGNEEFVGENFGRVNKPEARETLMALAEYFVKIGKQRIMDERIDVGIISPYRAQVQYIRHLIKKTDFFKPFRKIISVNTVDGFQGQERDVILVSLVRSNAEGQIGFLRDLRRMNVAITRARMKLIILGDVNTLTKHPFYKKLWEYCINRG